jgi:hypothetical protein
VLEVVRDGCGCSEPMPVAVNETDDGADDSHTRNVCTSDHLVASTCREALDRRPECADDRPTQRSED